MRIWKNAIHVHHLALPSHWWGPPADAAEAKLNARLPGTPYPYSYELGSHLDFLWIRTGRSYAGQRSKGSVRKSFNLSASAGFLPADGGEYVLVVFFCQQG